MITIDYSSWERGINSVMSNTSKSLGEVLKQQSRLFVNWAIKLTPPTGNAPFTENASTQRKFGENAIRRDVNRVFQPITELKVFEGENRIARKLRKLAIRGDAAGVKEILRVVFKTDVEVIPEASAILHKYARTKWGRVSSKFKRIVVLKPRTIEQLIKSLFLKVGSGKAGWSIAALKTGATMPSWAKRHSQPGLFSDNTKDQNYPSITVANLVGYAQKHNNTARIIQRALDKTADSMLHQMDAALGKVFRGYR